MLAIERPWTSRALERFLNKYGHGHPGEKPVELRQKLWRLHAISGLAVFGPGYACHTPFPVMMCEWDRCYIIIGRIRHSPRGDLCRIAANRNSRFHRQ